jgi:glycosyltransferase involved in cell wall biosynthesis
MLYSSESEEGFATGLLEAMAAGATSHLIRKILSPIGFK